METLEGWKSSGIMNLLRVLDGRGVFVLGRILGAASKPVGESLNL